MNIMGDDGNLPDLQASMGYDTNSQGLTKMIREQLINNGKMSEQKALAIENGAGKSAMRGGDHHLGKTVSIGLDGKFESVIYNKQSKGYNSDKHDDVVISHLQHTMSPQEMALKLKSSMFMDNNKAFTKLGKKFLKNNSAALKGHIGKMKVDVVNAIGDNMSQLDLDSGFKDELAKALKNNK